MFLLFVAEFYGLLQSVLTWLRMGSGRCGWDVENGDLSSEHVDHLA